MKKLLQLVCCFFLLIPFNSNATHFAGGEITWKCLGNGDYKFRMIFYRDCNGIAGGGAVTLNTTVPGIPAIPLNLIQQVSISFNGLQSNGVTACATCAAPLVNSGMLEKFVYESDSITLVGIPPAYGWKFSYGECCRSGSVSNITGPGSVGMSLRATMYPYPGQIASICLDNSPYFVETPIRGFCAGVQQKFSFATYDTDGDSLSYEWAATNDDIGNPITYAPGYSLTSQLPSTTQNPANVGPVLNNANGIFTYLGYTGGKFSTCVKVTSYRCSIKMSEIFRDVDLSILTNCPPLLGGTLNNPPIIYPPFTNKLNGLPSFTDTVYAGDLVEFDLGVVELSDFFTNSQPQTIKVETSGGTFGTNFPNINQGCEIAPCPTINPTLPSTVAIAGSFQFSWQTSNNHLQYSSNCFQADGKYKFQIKACDNYCPVNACVTEEFTIVILPRPYLEAPVLHCTEVTSTVS